MFQSETVLSISPAISLIIVIIIVMINVTKFLVWTQSFYPHSFMIINTEKENIYLYAIFNISVDAQNAVRLDLWFICLTILTENMLYFYIMLRDMISYSNLRMWVEK